MKPKKEAFIKAWVKTFGNINESCGAVEVHRQTYYDWLKNDTEFKDTIENEAVSEQFLDFLENKLVDKINESDTAALIFALKTKGKSRGYVERIERRQIGDEKIEIIVKGNKKWLK
jgi:carbamoylphosphate synthase small subunit